MATNALLLAATPRTPKYYATKNYGVHRVATEFRKQGTDTQVVHYFNRWDDDDLRKVVDIYCNDETVILGFSTLWWEQFEQSEKINTMERSRFIAEYARSKYPKIKIIAGGGSCKLFVEEPWHDIVDAIFEGMSEDDFIKYLHGVTGKGLLPLPNKTIHRVDVYNNISKNFEFQYSAIKYTPSDCLHHSEVPAIEVARGCIFSCKFCAFQLNGKKKLDYLKNGSKLRLELMRNYEEHGIQNYLLSDDTFNDSTYKIKELHEIFTSLPFKMRFATFLRLDLLNAHREQIKLLKEMGLIGTYFGVESFHKKAASNIGKGLDGDIAKELLAELKEEHWGNDVKIGVGLITGLPYETYESYDKTLEWIWDDNNKVDQVIPYPLQVWNPDNPRPHPWESEFQKKAKDHGFYWPENDSYNWHNTIGPVESFSEAKHIHKMYEDAVVETMRVKCGGFNVLKAYPLISSQDNAPTIDEVMQMDRFQYTRYIKKIEKDPTIEEKYVGKYKHKILTKSFLR